MLGATPGEFYADFDTNSSTLLLHTQWTRIHLKNWCRSVRNRLNRLEFMQSLNRQPVVITHLDHLDCQLQANNSDNQLTIQLNRKFINAQKQLELIDENDDNDVSRLIRCIGCILADNIAQRFMYRLFNFPSIVAQARFMAENCQALIVRDNINKLTINSMKKTLKLTINAFEINEATRDDQAAILILRRSLNKLNSVCWDNFMAKIKNYSNTNVPIQNIVSLQTLHDIIGLLTTCT